MKRKVFDELNDILTNKHQHEIVNDDDVVAFVEKRRLKELFNQVIEEYLKKEKMTIDSFWKKDIKILTKNYNDYQKEIFIQQVMYHLETTYWKPIKRVKENWKSLLLNEMNANGWNHPGTDQSSKIIEGQWSMDSTTKNDKRASRGKRIANKIASKKLLRSKSA